VPAKTPTGLPQIPRVEDSARGGGACYATGAVERERLLELLARVERGELTAATAADHLRELPFEVLPAGAGDAVIDHHRSLRTGIPEVVLGEWKTATQIASILRSLAKHGAGALATRVSSDKAVAVIAALPEAEYVETARVVRVAPVTPVRAGGTVAVVCAGTSDLPVAEECATTIEFLGCAVLRIVDVGVAGLHRLFARLADIRRADAVVVVAGMEGALPSVIAGLIDRPLIAVPTSVGYGVGAGGLVALASMLSSCAAGVVAVNIDNGFGAAVAAARVARGIVLGREGSAP
jgi:NCAIR mutase (PurE)-related protein